MGDAEVHKIEVRWACPLAKKENHVIYSGSDECG